MGLFSFFSRKIQGNAEVSVLGGTGESPENAVVIKASSSFEGVSAEYRYITTQCGIRDVDWKLKAQYLLDNGGTGKEMDLIEIELKDGSRRKFYFDISAFYSRF